MVEESFAGVMAQIFNDDGSTAKDFIFERKMLDGKVFAVRSAPTPACTASFALAEDIVDAAAEDFGWGSGVAKQNATSVFFEQPAKTTSSGGWLS
jgi:2-hydroxyglutarate dehydrogenase